VALLLGLTACSGSSPESASSAGYAGAPPRAASPQQQQDSGAKQGQQNTSAPVQNRQLVQTARIELTVPDPMAVVLSARGVATSLNGFTGQEESTTDVAMITLRVPPTSSTRRCSN